MKGGKRIVSEKDNIYDELCNVLTRYEESDDKKIDYEIDLTYLINLEDAAELFIG